MFICHSTSARAWSDGNAPPALLSVRYVAEPGSLTCLQPSAPRKAAAAAAGLLGAPEEGYLEGRCARAALKRGQRRVSPHSASQLGRPRAPPARCSPPRRPPPSRGTLPGAPRGGGGGRGGGGPAGGGGRVRQPLERARAGREGEAEAEPRETGTPGVGAGATRRGSAGERAGRGPRPGASRGTGRRRRRRRRAPCRSVK